MIAGCKFAVAIHFLSSFYFMVEVFYDVKS